MEIDKTSMPNINATKVGLLVRLEGKPGKEAEIEELLKSGLALVQEETATTVWFALRLDKSTFGIFDAFPDTAGRQAHLMGKVAEALFAKAPKLFSVPPIVEEVEILASKLAFKK